MILKDLRNALVSDYDVPVQDMLVVILEEGPVLGMVIGELDEPQ